MKILSKTTLGIITILSICSCSKGTKTTREKFLEKANEIDPNCPYKKAEVTFLYTFSSKDPKDEKQNEKKKYIGSFIKDSDGKWKAENQNNNSYAQNIFFEYVGYGYLPITEFASDSFKDFLFDPSSEDVTYYLNPFCVEYNHKNVSEFNTGKFVSTLYYLFEWDKYGYLVSAETKHEEKKTDNKHYCFETTGKVKIKYS